MNRSYKVLILATSYISARLGDAALDGACNSVRRRSEKYTDVIIDKCEEIPSHIHSKLKTAYENTCNATPIRKKRYIRSQFDDSAQYK